MRKLKLHEKKLLRKVDFFNNWTGEKNHREVKVMRRYHLQERNDYEQYNKIAGLVTSLICKLKMLDASDQFRIQITEQLLEKLYQAGVINTKDSVLAAEKMSVSSFCRRRLPVILQKNKFCQTLKEAITFIEQGHIRVGTEVETNPATLITRTMEDHIKWVDQSKVKKKIMEYKDKLDDYDLME